MNTKTTCLFKSTNIILTETTYRRFWQLDYFWCRTLIYPAEKKIFTDITIFFKLLRLKETCRKIKYQFIMKLITYKLDIAVDDANVFTLVQKYLSYFRFVGNIQ